MNRKNKRVVAQQIETLSESLADDFLEGLKSESPLMREQQRQGDCLEISSKESVKAGIFSITATPFDIKQANEANFDGLNLPASTHDCDLTRGEPDFSEIFDLSDYLLAFTREQVGYDERRHTAAAHALVSQKLEINSREKRIHEFNQIAFQFYDKLVQRLAHVGLSLGDLSNLVSDSRRLYNPGEWVGLQDKIKAKYSTREEIAMFDAVMQGMPVQQAVDKFMTEMKEKSDDIELV